MTTWTKERIAETLADHENWLTGEGGRSAALRGADLRGADLKRAHLRRANLKCADLQGADLQGADLRYANLRYVNLRDAALKCADLRGASLWGVIGNMVEIKSLQITTWPVTYTAERLQIGCENHKIEKWWGFADEEIALMDTLALDWWREWKEPLRKIIETSPAVPTGYESVPRRSPAYS